MKTKKLQKIVILLFVLCANHILNAQISEKHFWKNVRFGGGVGLNVGNGFFSGTLAPSVIYEVDRVFSFGIGLNATYNRQKNLYNSTILGGSLIGLANVIPEIQLSAEFEQLHVSRNFDDPSLLKDTYWTPALFLGAGYRSNNVTLGVRYDVLYNNNKSIYANAWMPFVRVYF
ncbi:alpha-ketoglutarate decarboxylase [Tamlana sedimentorum]|uniref:Alpha-ketoglutarate decarboxylase n=1 Tax=Neotamlana sedimentorum TaxID=1435349 RepID=A0A0D7W7T4_9FLAO|nr:alpha-ketoglutarate decarboxylase [Tamlana sedimentorum]KJD35186.1 alpha-ketoglutarate decarboxylase [Tamlana sedimentorum]